MISLKSKGLSRVFSNTQKHEFFNATNYSLVSIILLKLKKSTELIVFKLLTASLGQETLLPTSSFFHFFPSLSLFSAFLPFYQLFFSFFHPLTVFTFVRSYISDVLQAVFPCFLLHCGCLGAKSLQSCPTLCHLMDCSPPGSSVHGILQARILEWVVMPSSGGSF